METLHLLGLRRSSWASTRPAPVLVIYYWRCAPQNSLQHTDHLHTLPSIMATTAYIPSVGRPRDTSPVAALTTIFTPPASCLNTLFVEYYTQAQPPNNLGNTHLTLGLMPMSQCFPVSYLEEYWHSGVGYYSPAVCPSGYTSACDVLHVSTNGFLWGPSLLPSETAYKCCPL